MPAKADPVPVIYPDRMLPPPIAPEGFKAIARRCPQVVEFHGGIQLNQPPASLFGDGGGDGLRLKAGENGCRQLICEACDHLFSVMTTSIMTLSVYIRKRYIIAPLSARSLFYGSSRIDYSIAI